MLPVVVVDVGGDGLDPARTRSLVGKELAVEAVAADDPRASESIGRVDVVSKDGKLTVRYRKVDAPIERTIPVANEPGRADSDAAYLAGNLARDEANELTPANDLTPATPNKPTPATPSPKSSIGEDDHRYAQLRAYVGDLSKDSRDTSFRGGATLAAVGALALTPGIYLTAAGRLDERSDQELAIASYVTGGLLIGIGVVAMVVKNDIYEPLVKAVRTQDLRSVSSEDKIARVEAEWKSRIAAEQSAQKTSAIVSFVLAGLLITTGAVTLATDSDASAGLNATLIGIGGLNVVTGIVSLASVGPMERSYRQWQTISNPEALPAASSAPAVGFGIAPTTGGASAAFSIGF